jgi:hypothetical protein
MASQSLLLVALLSGLVVFTIPFLKTASNTLFQPEQSETTPEKDSASFKSSFQNNLLAPDVQEFDRSVFNGQPSGMKVWAIATEKALLNKALQSSGNVLKSPLRVMTPNALPLETFSAKSQANSLLVVSPKLLPTKDSIQNQAHQSQPHSLIKTLSPKTWDSLLSWVYQGHTLVWFAEDTALLPLLNQLRDHPLAGKQGEPRVPRLEFHRKRSLIEQPLFPDITLRSYLKHPVLAPLGSSFTAGELSQAIPLLWTAAHQPVVVKLSFGKGLLILGTVPQLFENRYLFEPKNDNHQFLSNLFSQLPLPIAVEETQYGYTGKPTNFMRYFLHSPLSLFVFHVLMLWLLVFWRASSPAFFNRGVSRKTEEGIPSLALFKQFSQLAKKHRCATVALAPHLRRIDKQFKKLDAGDGSTGQTSSELERTLKGVLEGSLLLSSWERSHAIVAAELPVKEADVLRLVQHLQRIESLIIKNNDSLSKKRFNV